MTTRTVTTRTAKTQASTLMQQMDPRRHLAAAIGWAVFAVVALASLAAANLAASEAERLARADTERLLTQFAAQVRQTLAAALHTRLSIVQATAAQVVASEDRGDLALTLHLAALRQQFPEFAWVGVADTTGRVVAASGSAAAGANVAAQPWFGPAQAGPQLMAVAAPGTPGASGPAVDLAVPIAHSPDRLVGVLGAQLSWDWMAGRLRDALSLLDTHRRLELIVWDAGGRVLIGPADAIGQPVMADPAGQGRYLVGRAAVPAAQGTDRRPMLPWTVLVRQPAEAALASADAARRAVFFTVLLAGLASALAAVAVTRTLTRRLGGLAEQARAVRRGERQALSVPAGEDEVAAIGATVAELVGHLQAEKAALAQLNTELDARVAERTERIERLAQDARHAAVNRERLRLARDLHDTLAHSLMALLTQIRLVRKLHGRWTEAEVQAELERAEGVAASGLAEARAAITQMRHNGVQEAGLGAALQDLLQRLGERSGLQTQCQADAAVAGQSDERAATVFRMVEEALRNVERHAQATRVSLRLQAQGGGAGSSEGASVQRCAVSVQDDGIGFDTATPHPGHYGLQGMQEQAALIGAHLAITSRPGEGTELRIEWMV